jgi:hypothetical protein
MCTATSGIAQDVSPNDHGPYENVCTAKVGVYKWSLSAHLPTVHSCDHREGVERIRNQRHIYNGRTIQKRDLYNDLSTVDIPERFFQRPITTNLTTRHSLTRI